MMLMGSFSYCFPHKEIFVKAFILAKFVYNLLLILQYKIVIHNGDDAIIFEIIYFLHELRKGTKYYATHIKT